MTARALLLAWGAALLAMLALDMLWLTVLMGARYQAWIGPLMLAEPKWLPAVLFYLLYAVGVTVFAVRPALVASSWQRAAALGALLGLVAYATYDLSNLSTLKGWPVPMAVVDMAWGALLSGTAACAGYFMGRSGLARAA